jgi:hypothetical protein
MRILLALALWLAAVAGREEEEAGKNVCREWKMFSRRKRKVEDARAI